MHIKIYFSPISNKNMANTSLLFYGKDKRFSYGKTIKL